VARVTYLLRMAEITSGSSSEPNNTMEQKLESENDLKKKTLTLKS